MRTLGFILMLAAVATAQSLSPQFRKEAWRAEDAIQRIPDEVFIHAQVVLPGQQVDPGESLRAYDAAKGRYSALFVDVDKAIAEAKYEARTPADQTLLGIIQEEWIDLQYQGWHDARTSQFRSSRDRALQCHVEAVVQIHPDDTSKSGRDQARLKTCLNDSAWVRKNIH